MPGCEFVLFVLCSYIRIGFCNKQMDDHTAERGASSCAADHGSVRLMISGGGRWPNQVGLIGWQENISMVKIKILWRPIAPPFPRLRLKTAINN